MKLRQIRYFLAICEHRSCTGAARFCGVSQPSLTAAIKRLELELGGLLFTRGYRTVVVTTLARHIQPDLRAVARAAE